MFLFYFIFSSRFHSNMTMLTENRHSESGLQRLLIMHIILEGPWGTASSSYVVLMKQNVNVCQMHPHCTISFTDMLYYMHSVPHCPRQRQADAHLVRRVKKAKDLRLRDLHDELMSGSGASSIGVYWLRIIYR